ncbi:TIGR03089 family protein [Acidipropionibacterium timonense]|uniref:TIGR03089 family protein n=1 Tax=Acidipropionibacterium timonense TaxID=2161818 RepID=UPI001AEC2F3C|nr:TIGR03089 family protein [Acidipropionibacterium timonense]
MMPSLPGSSRPGPTPDARSLTDAMRSRSADPRPLLTWVHGPDRVELSGTTTMTWVAKTVQLLADEGVVAPARIGLPVLGDRPGHWVGAVWLLSCWWAGWTPVLATDARVDPGTLDVVVTGPDDAAGRAAPTALFVQCSLDALGRPCAHPAPGALDHADCLAMPDALPPAGPTGEPWWAPGAVGPSPIADRVLLDRPAPAVVAGTLAGCLLGGGSLVLLDGPADGSVYDLARAEGARRPG